MKKKKFIRKFVAYILHDEVAGQTLRFENELTADRELYERIAAYDKRVMNGTLPHNYRCFITRDYVLI